MEKIGWIDSHAHLASSTFEHNIEMVIQQAQQANVERILIVAVEIQEAKRAIEIAQKYTMCDVAIGFHPSDLHLIPSNGYEDLEELIQRKEVVAVGEIGLDYYWHKDNKELQKEHFVRQIKLANQYKRPIIVHMRDATQDTYQLLKDNPPQFGGVMHCYSGSAEMALKFIDCGLMISLGGPVTFTNAQTPKEVARAIPLDKLLIETDSPYLTPHPLRGKPNNPSYVHFVGKQIASLRNMSEIDLQKAVSANYKALFKG